MLRAFSSRNMGGDEVLGSGSIFVQLNQKKAKEILEIDFF